MERRWLPAARAASHARVTDSASVAQSSRVLRIPAGDRRLDIIQLRTLCPILNVTLPEFIRRLEKELAEVKATITRITRPDGWDVLNADDPRVLAMRRQATGRPWLFSLDAADGRAR